MYPRLIEIAFHDISAAEMKCYLNKSNTFYISLQKTYQNACVTQNVWDLEGLVCV